MIAFWVLAQCTMAHTTYRLPVTVTSSAVAACTALFCLHPPEGHSTIKGLFSPVTAEQEQGLHSIDKYSVTE